MLDLPYMHWALQPKFNTGSLNWGGGGGGGGGSFISELAKHRQTVDRQYSINST